MTNTADITDWEEKLCSLWGMALCNEDPAIGFDILSRELYGAFVLENNDTKSETLNFLIYITDDLINRYSNNKGCPKTPFRDVKKTSLCTVIGSSACTVPQV